MKLLISTAVLLLSANAFAACPAGTQGSSSFTEAARTMKVFLNQDLRVGSHADEKTKAGDDRPIRVLFGKLKRDVTITVFRSSGGGKLYDNQQLGPVVAEICSGGGQVVAITNGYTIPIAAKGSGLSITLASYGTYEFREITGGVDVASDGGSTR